MKYNYYDNGHDWWFVWEHNVYMETYDERGGPRWIELHEDGGVKITGIPKRSVQECHDCAETFEDLGYERDEKLELTKTKGE